MIQRTFHPIGQGAFYSERHEKYNIVYDCGNLHNTKLGDKVIKQAFSKDDEIEVLFISHFDYDHVSKISTLKNHVKRIKNVVLPLLCEQEKNILLNIYRVLKLDILTLINNPERYFGKDTNLIYVSPPNNNTDVINDRIEIININALEFNRSNRKEIQSGNGLTLNNSNDWIFVPYNHEHKLKRQQLIEELKKEGFDTNRLMNDPNYVLDEIIKDVNLTKKQGGKKFNEIYERLSGNINQNSMILYSGPYCNKNYRIGLFNHRILYHLFYDKVGCIYTGDTDLNTVNINSFFKSIWKYVGTIQIPHHGDIKSFNKDILNDGLFCCPISFSTTNIYGHPSPIIIGEIIKNQSCPIFVTEKLDDFFIEIIELE